MKSSVILSVFATLVAANWTSDCAAWSSTDGRRALTATCSSRSGTSVCSKLDLNDCLAFNGSSLLWEVGGNFSLPNASLSDGINECVDAQELCTYLSKARGSTILKCDCLNADSGKFVDVSIDLAERISVNSDGYLTCLGQTASAC